eukprot:3322429-Pyramimonas_sp.AAC.1
MPSARRPRHDRLRAAPPSPREGAHVRARPRRGPLLASARSPRPAGGGDESLQRSAQRASEQQ